MEDDETFDPDQDLRDYNQVAMSLPVFCVSSRAYQKLSGKLLMDDFQSHGYTATEDTEIPQLQEHTRKLTAVARASHARHFLNELGQLINSMKLWASAHDTQPIFTESEKIREEIHLRQLISTLEEVSPFMHVSRLCNSQFNN